MTPPRRPRTAPACWPRWASRCWPRARISCAASMASPTPTSAATSTPINVTAVVSKRANSAASLLSPWTQIVSASDPDDEVRSAIRLVVDALREGVPLERMAILYGDVSGNWEPSAGLLAGSTRKAPLQAELDAIGLMRGDPSLRSVPIRQSPVLSNRSSPSAASSGATSGRSPSSGGGGSSLTVSQRHQLGHWSATST